MAMSVKYSLLYDRVESMSEIKKAIIPVAGWGTRMLPITKSIEKCMLPIGTRPVIDYVVEDIVRAGIRDICFVVSERSDQIRSFYSQNIRLEDFLKSRGKSDKLPLIALPDGIKFSFVTQPDNDEYGSSIPVKLVNDMIGTDEKALVIMGDQFLYRTDGGSNTADLIKLLDDSGTDAALLGVPVPEADIPKYGIIEKDAQGNFVQIVEKPKIEDAPSNLNNASFYIFPKRVFELATSLPANPIRGEFEITDAINSFVSEDGKIVVGEGKGDYLDGGSLDGWLHANRVVFGE